MGRTGVHETTMNTEKKSPFQIADDILCHLVPI